MKWEQIDKTTFRTPVFNGWLVKSVDIIDVYDINNIVVSRSQSISICFLPDSTHGWIPRV